MSSSKSNTQPLSLTQVAAESLPPNVEGLITQVAAPPSVNEKSVQSEPNSNVQDEKLKSNSCPRRKNVFKKFIDYVLCLHLCKARSNNKPKKRETKQPHIQEVKIVPKVEIERPILSNDLVQQTKPETDQALVEKQKINEAQANSGDFLLGPPTKEYENKKLLVLDLDETLVHSSFKLIDKPDFIVPVEIDNQAYNVYVSKRPGVDEFLEAMGQIYEIVVFTASLAKYADPVLDILDKKKVVQHRLFREACSYYQGCYVKDLSKIGRPLNEVIIIDNSPASYAFHPQNAVPVTSWFNDEHDTELLDLIPYLKTLANARDVVQALEMSTKIKENTSHNSSSPLPLIC